MSMKTAGELAMERGATVRRLRALVKHLEAELRDFAEHGLRADLTPTMVPGANYSKGKEVEFMQTYLRECDTSVRQRAKDALKKGSRIQRGSSVAPAPPAVRLEPTRQRPVVRFRCGHEAHLKARDVRAILSLVADGSGYTMNEACPVCGKASRMAALRVRYAP